ncbi:MAG: UPF0280 family protein [Sedimentisphaerales bacterium]|nr:UPF0280 family protein [Sedimentisphaerales bacterium]
MSRQRIFRSFTHRQAAFRICCEPFEAVTAEIVRQRRILEQYIERHPAFLDALEPLILKKDAPPVARRMARAARRVGVGPMAAVAGAMAQLAGEAGLRAGAREAIVENGGDIYLQIAEPLIVKLFSGETALADRLAFSLQPDDGPMSICSSSGRMGHSLSLGSCNLATVVARDASLADAGATQAANLVKTTEDIDAALNRIAAIKGIDGVLIIQNDRVGLAGHLPPLIKVNE